MGEKLQNSIATADPSKFSLREEALDFGGALPLREDRFPIAFEGQPRPQDVYIDKVTGEKFIKILKQDPEFQRLASMFFKGVINVSDVIKIGEQYYSHQQDFSKIKPTTENVLSEMEADCLLLELVILDSDHGYFPPKSTERQNTEKIAKNSQQEHNNLIINEVEGKLNFFDFNKAEFGFRGDEIFPVKCVMFKKLLEGRIGSGLERGGIINILKRKVSLLVQMYPENNRDFFLAILKKSGLDLEDKSIEGLFQNIQVRLQALSKVLSELEPSALEART